MGTDKHAGGRPPTGTGAHHITVSESNKGSWQLIIGKELWRAIGKPARVILERRGTSLHIIPVDPDLADPDEPEGYAVSGGDSHSAARISIGKRVAREEYGLGVGVCEGCAVEGGGIVVRLR